VNIWPWPERCVHVCQANAERPEFSKNGGKRNDKVRDEIKARGVGL
jgi:hypothetical protein